jgi:type IV pilus assembly protein PilE
MSNGNQRGFTLIELMIVVAIISVLAVIAYPLYKGYKEKVNRTEVKAEMMQLAAQLQKYKAIRGSYVVGNTAIDLSAITGVATVNYPNTGTTLYQISLANVTRNGWVLVATPQNQQSTDGTIRLNHRGEKCWTKGSSTCEPAATSNWDGS